MPRTPKRSPRRPDPTALPDPFEVDWRPSRPTGATSDPRSAPGWAASLPEASSGERLLVEAQLGRPARGSLAIAARCRYGLPAVVRTVPQLPDGTPFPTLYWLTCPAARVAVGRLEAAGWNAALSERVAGRGRRTPGEAQGIGEGGGVGPGRGPGHRVTRAGPRAGA